MRFSLIVAVRPALFVCNVARAQVGTATPTPTIGETSPLGIATGSANSPTGIPLGATELASPGVSPVPSGVTGTITIPSTSSGTACSTNWLWPGQLVKARIGQAARWQGCRAAFPTPDLLKGA
jgi:hypothetical protein